MKSRTTMELPSIPEQRDVPRVHSDEEVFRRQWRTNQWRAPENRNRSPRQGLSDAPESPDTAGSPHDTPDSPDAHDAALSDGVSMQARFQPSPTHTTPPSTIPSTSSSTAAAPGDASASGNSNDNGNDSSNLHTPEEPNRPLDNGPTKPCRRGSLDNANVAAMPVAASASGGPLSDAKDLQQQQQQQQQPQMCLSHDLHENQEGVLLDRRFETSLLNNAYNRAMNIFSDSDSVTTADSRRSSSSMSSTSSASVSIASDSSASFISFSSSASSVLSSATWSISSSGSLKQMPTLASAPSRKSLASSPSSKSLAPTEFVLISGGPGTGKTSLAGYLASRVKQDGGDLLLARCLAPVCVGVEVRSNTNRSKTNKAGLASTSNKASRSVQQPYMPFVSLLEQIAATIAPIPTMDADPLDFHKASASRQTQACADSPSRLWRKISKALSLDEKTALGNVCPSMRKLFPPVDALDTARAKQAAKARADKQQHQWTVEDYTLTTNSAARIACAKFLNLYCDSRDTPLIIVLDDIHWMDDASVSLLQDILLPPNTDDPSLPPVTTPTRRPIGQGLLVIATCDSSRRRPHENRRTLSEIRQSFVINHPQASTTELSGLSLRTVTSMLSNHFTGILTQTQIHKAAAALIEQTDGNPFWVRQWLRQLSHQVTAQREQEQQDRLRQLERQRHMSDIHSQAHRHASMPVLPTRTWDDPVNPEVSKETLMGTIPHAIETASATCMMAHRLMQIASCLGVSFDGSILIGIVIEMQNGASALSTPTSHDAMPHDATSNSVLASIRSAIDVLTSSGIMHVDCCVHEECVHNAACLNHAHQHVLADNLSSQTPFSMEWTNRLLQEEAYRSIPKDRVSHLHKFIGQTLMHLVDLDPTLSARFVHVAAVQLVSSLCGDAHSQVDRDAELLNNELVRAATAVSAAASQALKVQQHRVAHVHFELARDLLFHHGTTHDQKVTDEANLGIWLEGYNIALDIMTGLAISSSAIGNYTEAEHITNTVISYSRSFVDRIPVLELKMHQLLLQNRVDEAIAAGVEILHDLGYEFPFHKKFCRRRVVQKWRSSLKRLQQMVSHLPASSSKASLNSTTASAPTAKTQDLLSSFVELGTFRRMNAIGVGRAGATSEKQRSQIALRIIRILAIPLLRHQHRYFRYIPEIVSVCLKRIVLTQDLTADASIVFMLYGIVLTQPSVGMESDGVQCGEIAVQIAKRCHASKGLQCLLNTLHDSFCKPCCSPLGDYATHQPLALTDPGCPVEVAAIDLHSRAMAMLCAGSDLHQILSLVRVGRSKLIDRMDQLGMERFLQPSRSSPGVATLPQSLLYIDMMLHSINSLTGHGKEGASPPPNNIHEDRLLAASTFNEASALKHFCETGAKQGIQLLIFWKAFEAFHSGKYDEAHDSINQIRALSGATDMFGLKINSSSSSIMAHAGCTDYFIRLQLTFMETMCLIIVDRGRSSRRLRSAMATMEQVFGCCPANTKSKLLLCQAELAAQRHQSSVAVQKYQESLDAARAGSTKVDHAMALTRLALCYTRDPSGSENAWRIGLSTKMTKIASSRDVSRESSIAKAYLVEARRIYSEWGCQRMVTRLAHLILHANEEINDKTETRRNRVQSHHHSGGTHHTDIMSSFYDDGAASSESAEFHLRHQSCQASTVSSSSSSSSVSHISLPMSL